MESKEIHHMTNSGMTGLTKAHVLLTYLHIYLLTYLLIPWSRVLLENTNKL